MVLTFFAPNVRLGRMKRIYDTLLLEHLKENRQMAFLTGPRQVGKTTTACTSAGSPRYFNWDRQSDRLTILRGADAVGDSLGLDTLNATPPVAVFDEIHKYAKWKPFLKGFFDAFSNRCRVIVTGSSRLNIYKRGSDSLMGRYFIYRMHPLSVAELLSADISEKEIRDPVKSDPAAFETLLTFGGFPEPYLKNARRFYNRWRNLRTEQLFREDLRDITRIQEIGQVQALAEHLRHQAGQLINLSTLANRVNASVDTIRRWLVTLESLYYCFTIRPWFRNVAKSLRKQPKVYCWDWSILDDIGARRENLVASHLLKAVHWWTDIGLGQYDLCYMRDKAKREVDFLVVRNQRPWFLVEVKSSGKRELSPALAYFQRQTGAEHAFQIAFDLDFVAADCFVGAQPKRVPATTLLSQLV